MVPELSKFSNVDLHVLFNKDSSHVGPEDWVQIARVLDASRPAYDAFMVRAPRGPCLLRLESYRSVCLVWL